LNWGRDPQSDLITPNIDHGDDDIIADDDTFVAVSGQDQHRFRLLPPASEARDPSLITLPTTDGARDGTLPVTLRVLSHTGYAVGRSGDGPSSRFGAEVEPPVSSGYRTGYRLDVKTSCRPRRRIGLNTSGPWRLTVSPPPSPRFKMT